MSEIKNIRDYINKIGLVKSRIEFIEKRTVRIGWVDGKKAKPQPGQLLPMTYARIARILNDGHPAGVSDSGRKYPALPPRPFMEVYRKFNWRDMLKIGEQQLRLVVNMKKKPGDALNRIGVEGKGRLQRAMLKSEKYAANAPYTIKAKKSARPLFDSGDTIRAVSFSVDTIKHIKN